MAIYTNLEAIAANKHGVFESSNLKSTIVGNIYDALVVDSANKTIPVDNGVAIAIGDYTGNGLQERKATVAKKTDVIAVVGTPAVIKTAFTQEQAQEYNFFNPAGKPVKAYEVVADDVFAVADYQFSKGKIAVGATVVVDGDGAWEVVDAATTEKFVGKIHSIAEGQLGFKTVRIACVKNA